MAKIWSDKRVVFSPWIIVPLSSYYPEESTRVPRQGKAAAVVSSYAAMVRFGYIGSYPD